MFKTNKRGFTLIELLVVIAIIGILSSVVLASLNSARKKSRDARRISDLKQLQLALEMAYDASESYPTTASTTSVLATGGYIPAVPTDPKNSGTAYGYASDGETYTLGATLEVANKALDSDVDTDNGSVSCDQPLEYCVTN